MVQNNVMPINFERTITSSKEKFVLLSSIRPLPDMSKVYAGVMDYCSASGKKYLFIDLCNVTADQGVYDMVKDGDYELANYIIKGNYDSILNGTAHINPNMMLQLVNNQEFLECLKDLYDKIVINLPDINSSNLLFACYNLSRDVILSIPEDKCKIKWVRNVIADLKDLDMQVIGFNYIKKKHFWNRNK